MSQSFLDPDRPRDMLRTLSTKELQDAIAKAVGDLLGVPYKCEIKNIDYGNTQLIDGADMSVSIYEDIFRPEGKAEG